MRTTSFALVISLTVASEAKPQPSNPRSVILFIGDGFGAAQAALGLDYAQMVEGRELHIEGLMRDGNTGYALPLPFEAVVTDSAAGAV